jgi:nitronate monooxygenase
MTAAALPFLSQLTLPVIAAPMLRVSGIELVSAACRAGVVGAFPTPNTRDMEELRAWVLRLEEESQRARDRGERVGPYCPNLIMRRDPDHVRQAALLFARHRTQVVIASVGSPAAVMPILRDGGVKVLCDVASMRHVEKALELGVDGLVLLTAGAGGTTGWANPFAFVRAVRRIYDGPVVLSGGVSDGVALRAALALGCTLVNVGTRLIATRESMATDGYKQMLVASSLDDIVKSKAVTGLDVNWLRGSLVAAGLDPARLEDEPSLEEARRRYGKNNTTGAPERWSAIWSAGHSVSGVADVPTVAEVVRRMHDEFLVEPATADLRTDNDRKHDDN